MFTIPDAMFIVISLKTINCELTLTTHSNNSWFPFSQDETKLRRALNTLRSHNQWRVKPNKIKYFLENVADTTISFFSLPGIYNCYPEANIYSILYNKELK